ncbi:MAG: ROK family protein [Deltaproteobacteria bacterium]|nr:ROK family protein [Deltaproteobacteria bacterium]
MLLGIDIGGTKVGVCVGDTAGNVVASRRFGTDHAQRPEEVLAKALGELQALLRSTTSQYPDAKTQSGALRSPSLEAQSGALRSPTLGVAVPGPYHAGRRAFLEPPNMPRWHGFELGAWLDKNSPWPSAAMNDANAAALAEHYWGAGVGFRNVVFFTMSTGMGAGFVLEGRLYEGTDGFAAEIGHLRLEADGPVGFGRRGSVEGYLSGPGMAQVAAAERLACRQTGEATALAAIPEAELTSARLCEAARAGDVAARRAVERIAGKLGLLMAMLTDLLNPQVFILGTIGSAYPDLFIPLATEVLRREAIGASAAIVRVVPSGLKDLGNQQALAVASDKERRSVGSEEQSAG